MIHLSEGRFELAKRIINVSDTCMRIFYVEVNINQFKHRYRVSFMVIRGLIRVGIFIEGINSITSKVMQCL